MIAVAANFTAEPLTPSLRFWLDALGLDLAVEFAPYDQLFQFLLDPAGLLAGNATGINVVLLKLDVWMRDEGAAVGNASRPTLEQHAEEFASALAEAAQRARSPIVLILTPSKPWVRADVARSARLDAVALALQARLADVPRVQVITHEALAATYPVVEYYDEASEALGQIPYAPALFAALGTTIARAARTACTAPYKVLVLDCDNTLWRGVVGEAGPDGVVLDAPLRAFHETVLRLEASGMLICLCSKNNETDVLELFRRRPDMPLTLDRVTRHRINWEPKSANIRALAEELNLGLDSFVFVDDSAFEVDEVRAHCPGVLALQFPAADDDITRFLAHTWAFDRPAATAEDRGRSGSYRAEVQRDVERQSASTLDDFLERLGLVVEIAPPAGDDWARASQMTLRTNQFNFTTIRRTEGEVRAFAEQPNARCHIVRVRDRFGDYGIVGLMLSVVESAAVRVDTFLLSCRALGRRAEQRMLAELGREAATAGGVPVMLPFVASAKNAPALAFLESLGLAAVRSSDGALTYAVPCDVALTAPTRSDATPAAATLDEAVDRNQPSGAPANPLLTLQPRITQGLHAMLPLIRVLGQERSRLSPPGGMAVVVDPRDDTERAVAAAWCTAIGLDRVGIHDDFFEVGGDSIIAVRMCAIVGRTTGVRITPAVLFEAPTIARLARLMRAPKGPTTADAQAPRSLMALQTAGSRPPLFCMHAGAGSVFFYSELAQALGDEQPVYGLQARGLYSDDPPSTTIEEMASRYVREIRSVQPHGPYHLVGFCLGAMIAFEMAQQLTRAGEPVALLASLDGRSPGFPSEAEIEFTNSAPEVAARRELPWWTRALPRAWGRELVRDLDALSQLPGSRRRAYFTQQWKARRTRFFRSQLLYAASWLTGGAIPRRYRAMAWYVGLQNSFAERRYDPPAYAGRMHVFTVAGRYADPGLGWERFVRGSVLIERVPGELIHHRALMGAPIVQTLASLLDAAMRSEAKEAEPECASPARAASPRTVVRA